MAGSLQFKGSCPILFSAIKDLKKKRKDPDPSHTEISH
jgi:hypothetical protein